MLCQAAGKQNDCYTKQEIGDHENCECANPFKEGLSRLKDRLGINRNLRFYKAIGDEGRDDGHEEGKNG